MLTINLEMGLVMTAKKKAVWMVSGGPMQASLAQVIKKSDFQLIVSDGSKDCFCRALADVFLNIDTFDATAHKLAATDLLKNFDICAVITVSADCHYTVNALAQSLDLPHLPVEISEICRHKIKTREMLRLAGLPQPWSLSTDSCSAAKTYWERFGGEAVLKSTDSSGSRGFQIMKKFEQLNEKSFAYSKNFGTTGQVIIEKRLDVDPEQISEASVETVWSNGVMHWLNWVDRIFGLDLVHLPELNNTFAAVEGVELAHLNPARRERHIKLEVYRQMEAAGKALGMDRVKGAHVLKGDIFFDRSGPVILELTPRCSGGWDSCGSSVLRGSKIHEGLLQLALGHKLDLDLWTKYFHFDFAENSVAVLAQVDQNAVDCIGRNFVMCESSKSMESAIVGAVAKLKKGEYFVPLL